MIVMALTPPAVHARSCAALLISDGGFEQQYAETLHRPWVAEGSDVHVNRGQGFAREGQNNVEVIGETGWNGIRQSIYLYEGKSYTLSVWARAAPNLQFGSIGVRGKTQATLFEQAFAAAPDGAYERVALTFRAPYTGNYRVFAGFAGAGAPTWVRIDDVDIDGPCAARRPSVSVPQASVGGEPELPAGLSRGTPRPPAESTNPTDH